MSKTAQFVLVVTLLLWFLPGQGKASDRGAKPNIVMIMIDTLRADVLGACGGNKMVAPELDAIAVSGTVFVNAISQSSWTRSSIASILTSQYPRTLGVLKEKWDPLPLSAYTIAEALHDAGYFTIGVTGNPHLNRSFQFEQGFDRYVDSHIVFPWMKDEEGKSKMSKEARIASGSETLRTLLDEVKSSPARPMYLQALLMDVHGHKRIPAREITPALAALPNAAYLEGVHRASRAIGEFLSELKKMPGFENTLVVITSDHGEGLDSHPAVKNSGQHGNLLYDSQVHVPLIIQSFSDKFWKGKRIEQDVALLDLMPTLLEVAGTAPHEMVGRSFMSLVRTPQEKKEFHDFIFTETRWREVEKVAALNKEWLYVSNRDEWEGVPREELQRRGQPQNGKLTDRSLKESGVLARLKAALMNWEAKNPVNAKEAEESQSEPMPGEVNQLKTLGYL